jgi:hypothetical protein
VADRCLYGVDKNPLAVEMAKLSLWLITLAKGQPFSFLDHALRTGDSLLGLSDVEQLMNWSLGDGSRKAAEPQRRERKHSDLGALASLREASDVALRERPVQYNLIRPQVERALAVALRERRKIAGTPVREAGDAARKAGWLSTAESALELVKLGADLLLAAELHPDKPMRETLRNDWLARYSLLLSAAEAARGQGSGARGQGSGARGQGSGGGGQDHTEELFAELRREADGLLQGRKPFHWPLEFPEVFAEGAGVGVQGSGAEQVSLDAMLAEAETGALDPKPWTLNPGGGFAAIIGNPPFQGGQRITGALGTSYRDYLVQHLAGGQRGSADLCAYFFLRSADALQPGGMAGLVATNTIAQGDTREVGLDQLAARGFSIPRAVPSRPWPGNAAVEVAHVWLRSGGWQGAYALDEKPVAAISPFLSVPGAAQGNPYRLKANEGKSFQGSIVLGMGFVLEPDEAQALIAKDPRNAEALFPYLNGEDLNSRPDQSPSRWVINFQDWPLERAETYPDLMAIVREKVKPERDKNNRTQRRERWWQYAERAPALYATIAGMERVLVKTQVSRYWAFEFTSSHIVFDQRLVVFADNDYFLFSLLQSEIHWTWAVEHASTMKQDMSYTPTDVFATFPRPTKTSKLADIGKTFHEARKRIMGLNQEGLTKTVQKVSNPQNNSADIAELRRLHVAMDNAVAAAYGWDDLALDHGFHETKQGLRYTISEAARREVLDRLLALNHARYAEEVAAGLHDKKKGSGVRGQGSGKRGRKATAQEDAPRTQEAEPNTQLVFDLGEISPEPRTLTPEPSPRAEHRSPTPDPHTKLKALLAQRGSLSNGEVQAALGVDGEAARRLLQRLVDEGVAAVVGQKRGTRYVWRRGP